MQLKKKKICTFFFYIDSVSSTQDAQVCKVTAGGLPTMRYLAAHTRCLLVVIVDASYKLTTQNRQPPPPDDRLHIAAQRKIGRSNWLQSTRNKQTNQHANQQKQQPNKHKTQTTNKKTRRNQHKITTKQQPRCWWLTTGRLMSELHDQ